MSACLTTWNWLESKRNNRPVVGAEISKLEQKGKLMSESQSTVADSNSHVKLIPLTQGKFAIVDALDFDQLSQWKWYARKHHRCWYAERYTGGGRKFKARMSMHEAVIGIKGADHINGDGLDNRRSNLRPSTTSQNLCNRGKNKNNQSGFKGVWFRKDTKKWAADITIHRKHIHLGSFLTAEKAALAYDSAALKYHGEFARTNFKMEAACS